MSYKHIVINLLITMWSWLFLRSKEIFCVRSSAKINITIYTECNMAQLENKSSSRNSAELVQFSSIVPRCKINFDFCEKTWQYNMCLAPGFHLLCYTMAKSLCRFGGVNGVMRRGKAVALQTWEQVCAYYAGGIYFDFLQKAPGSFLHYSCFWMVVRFANVRQPPHTWSLR